MTTPTAEKLKSLYDQHGEKLRYLVVGFWNTVFNVALFNIFLLLFDRSHTYYLIWFWIAWALSVVQSTATMKFVVFRQPGHLWKQVGRAYIIYLPAQGLSTLVMWSAVQLAHVPVPIAQLIAVFITTIFSYIGHKYFTFKVPLEVGEVIDEELLEGPQA